MKEVMATQKYPPFSGDAPTCPKCGARGASTQYRGYGTCIHGGTGGTVLGFKPNERLHRECFRCSYAWDEMLAEESR